MRLLAIALGLSLALLAGCAEPEAHAAAPAPAKADPVKSLPCFGCHDAKRWAEGPGFSHELHEDAGHCHVCHVGMGHKGTSIDKEACKACHDEAPKY